MRFKKIFLAGDSAGANLITAVTTWAIQRKVRVPDGLFLCYPGYIYILLVKVKFIKITALNLDLKQYSPSVLLSLDDRIIPYSVLKICINSYIQNENWNALQDYFLSPLFIPNEVN